METDVEDLSVSSLTIEKGTHSVGVHWSPHNLQHARTHARSLYTLFTCIYPAYFTLTYIIHLHIQLSIQNRVAQGVPDPRVCICNVILQWVFHHDFFNVSF